MTVYKPASVEVEPSTTLTHWEIFKVGVEYHLNGYVPLARDGRFSSKLIEFDAERLIGKTRSGRVYHLIGEMGTNYDAAYVKHIWMNMNGVTEYERVHPKDVKI